MAALPTLTQLRGKLPPLEKLRLSQADIARMKKRLQPRAALALTLEAGRIVVSLVRLHLDDNGHDVIPARPVPIGADDVFKNPEKAGSVLAAALDAAGLREKRCAVCVPPDWALTASADLPPVEPDDLRGYLELRAEREFPVALNELRLAYSGYDLPDGNRRATLAALPARRLEAVEKMLAAAGRRAVSISLALSDSLAAHRRNGASPPMLHFLARSGHADVVITAGGGVAALRSLPGPAAASGDGNPMEGNHAPAFDPGAFARDIRITLGRLPQTVSQGVRQARFTGAPEFANALLLETRENLRRMGIEALAEDDPAASADETARASVTAETAAMRQMRRVPVPFEFVIPQPRRWEAAFVRYNTRVYRRIGATLACIILLPLLLFFARSWYEGHLASRWDGMKNNVADLDALNQKIRRFRPWFEPAPQNLQTLESLFGAFPEQGDVWARSIQINAAGLVTCVGSARNQAALIAMTGRLRGVQGVSGVNIKQLRGEDPIQFTLVCQWGTAR